MKYILKLKIFPFVLSTSLMLFLIYSYNSFPMYICLFLLGSGEVVVILVFMVRDCLNLLKVGVIISFFTFLFLLHVTENLTVNS